MVDITHKKVSLRIAKAEATVNCGSPDTIKAVINRTVPKGDVLEMAKTAGLFAVKRTHDMIPDCHPIPVEGTLVSYDIKDTSIVVSITVKAIYRTGMEVEAMHGASVIALTMYDMLKPIDKNIEISNIKLVEKSGGKSDLKAAVPKNITGTVLTAADEHKTALGEKLIGFMKDHGITNSRNIQVPFDTKTLQDQIISLVDEKVNLIFVIGGTGLNKTDNCPEIVREILDKEIETIKHQLTSYGKERTFKSLVSQPMAGIIGDAIIVCLPGSSKGAEEAYNAIMPETLYLFKSLFSKA